MQFIDSLSAEGTTLILLLFTALVFGFLIGRIKAYVFQNRGEALLSSKIKQKFPPPDYHLLNHVTLPTKDGSTQIDHILVSRYGVFVIETKNYKGWIFASENARQWTQVLYNTKFRFQNPLRQNYKHLCVVRELLDFLPPENINPAVVFTGDASFKKGIPDGVFTLSDFLDYVTSRPTEVMSLNRVQFCVGRLEMNRYSVTKETDLQHISNLRRRYGDFK